MTSVTLYTALVDAGIKKEVAQRVADEVITREQAKEFATKTDIAKLKTDLIMWMIGLLVAHSALIIAVLR